MAWSWAPGLILGATCTVRRDEPRRSRGVSGPSFGGCGWFLEGFRGCKIIFPLWPKAGYESDSSISGPVVGSSNSAVAPRLSSPGVRAARQESRQARALSKAWRGPGVDPFGPRQAHENHVSAHGHTLWGDGAVVVGAECRRSARRRHELALEWLHDAAAIGPSQAVQDIGKCEPVCEPLPKKAAKNCSPNMKSKGSGSSFLAK